MNKYIFLDVDGVLNSTRSTYALGPAARKISEEGYRRVFSHDAEIISAYEHQVTNYIDPIAVALINRLTDITRAKIVVSSTHRKHVSNLYKMQTYMEAFGLTGHVIDRTPVINGKRGVEIEYWLNKYGGEFYDYVIIDDDSDMLEHQSCNFVHTDAEFGFTHKDYLRCLEIFRDKDVI